MKLLNDGRKSRGTYYCAPARRKSTEESKINKCFTFVYF